MGSCLFHISRREDGLTDSCHLRLPHALDNSAGTPTRTDIISSKGLKHDILKKTFLLFICL